MKKLGKLILAFTLLFHISFVAAQDKNNQWQVSFGVNAVDFHPVGSDSDNNATGHLFSEFFNIQDNWNTQTAINTIGISRYGNDKFNFGLRGTLNQITRMGDERGRMSPKRLARLDILVDYKLGDAG